MTTAVIVQARTHSKRFPKKVLADLCGKPVLWYVLVRCLSIEGKDIVVLATPDEPESEALEEIARPLGVMTYRGPEDDVLSRYLGAARKFNASHIMRVTSDCPLIDPHVCTAVLAAVTRPKGADYASNVLPRTFEKGLDCEAFTRWVLELTAKRATIKYDREHVTPWMQQSKIFRRVNIDSGEPHRAEENLCVDYEHDLERLRQRMCREQAA